MLVVAAGALIAAAGSARVAAAQHPLVTLPLDDPVYAQLDGLVQLGCGAARVSAFRPFMVKDVRAALRTAKAESMCSGRLLDALASRFLADSVAADSAADAKTNRIRFGALASLQATGLDKGEMYPLWDDIRPTGQGTPPAVGTARLRLSFDGGPNVVLVSEAYGETESRNDPTVRANQFRHTSGVIDFSDAYASGKLGPMVLSVGRGREAWIGDGTESLVLSANGPALDKITLTAQWSKFEFKALVASLNDVVLTPATDSIPDSVGTQRYHRMMVAHALTWRPSHKVELTLGETALIPRQGGGIALNFVNPLMVFQVTQNDKSGDISQAGNVNLTAFGSVRANLDRFSLQGDLLIDDIQIDSQDRKNFPDLFGWNVRGTYALSLPVPADLGLQYRRVSAFTYLESFYTATWQQYDQPVGSELGPDADMARAFADVWPTGKFHVSAGISKWRRGDQRISRRPPPNRFGHAGAPFPFASGETPDVQSAWMGDASVQWLDPIIPLTLEIQGARVTNVNNVATPATTYGRVQLVATYRFRYP